MRKYLPSAVAKGIVTEVEPVSVCLGASAPTSRIASKSISPASNFESVERKNRVVDEIAATLPLLTVVSVTSIVAPGTTAAAALRFFTVKSGKVTVVRSSLVLFLGSVSVSSLVTLTVLVMVPETVVLTMITTVALAPLAKFPRSQTISVVTVQLPMLGVTETSATALGKTSVNSTSVALSGPLLVTVIV